MNTTLTIKLPTKLRDEAKKTAATLGLPLSTVIHRQLQQFVEDGEITFRAPVTLTEIKSSELSSAQKKKLQRAKKLPSKSFNNV